MPATAVQDQIKITNTENLILATDSYKLSHYEMYPKGTQTVYSYFESRNGAAHPYTQFFGLQYILKEFLSKPITWEDIEEASLIVNNHLGPNVFNYKGWSTLKNRYGGKLPIRIKAVPEGLVIPTSNVLMTVENTDPEFFWLTNALESLKTHVWYPTTVATRSYEVKQMLKDNLDRTSNGNYTGLDFMLHDFGYRGVSSHESGGIGGAAHLVNFKGTDTVPALLFAAKYYNADLSTLGFSVPATEHSVMTAMGEDGEFSVIESLLDHYPSGIISVVNDSYDYQRHVRWLCQHFKERILERDGVFVTRPDSVPTGQSPEDVVLWIAECLWRHFGGTINIQGNKVINPKIRILWGDGIEPNGIQKMLDKLALHSFAAENMAAFGMGGGLLQKVNRDTERFAFKSSAQERDGVWYDVFKATPGKDSKKGRFRLLKYSDQIGQTCYKTLNLEDKFAWAAVAYPNDKRKILNNDVLETVFEDGEIKKTYTFDEVRENALL